MPQKSLFISLSIAFFILSSCYVAFSLFRPAPINVVIITVKGLRDGVISRAATPHLDRAAANGYRFTQQRPVTGWTGTDIPSMMLSGLFPSETEDRTRKESPDENEAAATEAPARLIYKAVSFQDLAAIRAYRPPTSGGMARSSDFFFHLAQLKKQGGPFSIRYQYPGSRPLFGLTEENRSGIAGQLQQQAPKQPDPLQLIAEFDNWFGNFLEFFYQSGLQDNAILILAADRGDEHGERETARLPLFIWLPQSLYSGGNVKETFEPDQSLRDDSTQGFFSLARGGMEPLARCQPDNEKL